MTDTVNVQSTASTWFAEARQVACVARYRASGIVSAFVALLICSITVACSNEPVQLKEQVVESTRSEAVLRTQPPLINAEILQIGDAEVVTSAISGAVYVTREHRHLALNVGSKLLKGDLVEMTPVSGLVLQVAGRPAALFTTEKAAWYKLE